MRGDLEGSSLKDPELSSIPVPVESIALNLQRPRPNFQQRTQSRTIKFDTAYTCIPISRLGVYIYRDLYPSIPEIQ